MVIFLINALKIIFVLAFLILIHEGGHFIVAKICKVTVNEFSIGFGPIIWKKQGKNTKYTLRLIPLGGFVNLEGEEERSEKEGSFSKASIPKRMAIILAGGLVNIVFALVVYYCLMVGMGNHISLVVDDVVDKYAAQTSKIQKNDEILKINEKKLYTKNDIDDILSKCNGEKLNLTIKRKDEIKNISIIPTKQDANYYLGVYLKKAENTLSNSLYYAFFETKDFAFSIVDNLKMLVTGNIRVDQFMGPVGISEVVAKTSSIADYIYILALISLSLGITNLLPIPALDGGKFLLLIIEAIRRKKISEKVEINIQLIGFALLITLSLYITYHDILRIL